MKRNLLLGALVLACLVGLTNWGCGGRPVASGSFGKVIVDVDGPRGPYGKAVGDVNGDGLVDLVVGGHHPPPLAFWKRLLNKIGLGAYPWPEQGELVWYQNPDWTRHLVSDRYRFRTDVEVADIDSDGRNDLVALTDDGLIWFRNPDWTPTLIDERVLHDVEVADFDGDGNLDLVARNQSLFGHNDGDKLYFYRQETPGSWVRLARFTPQGEGLKVVDLDGDGRSDVLANQFWYRNPGALSDPAAWQAESYCPNWNWSDAFLDVRDMNHDGRPDVLMAPAEPAGSYYRISWCQAPTQPGAEWQERVVDGQVETVLHSILAGDFDHDGRIDLVTAAMPQGEGPEEVAVYWNRGAASPWSREVVATTGSHSMKAVDIDQDGDLDLFGANWSGDHQPVELWLNQGRNRTAAGWARHLLDAAKPWPSVFVMSADLDGDRLPDIVTGGWWYRNPGAIAGPWARQALGEGANNAALVADFDGDGAPDILASGWDGFHPPSFSRRLLRKLGLRSEPPPGSLVWARNDGRGNFQVHRNLPAGKGDFLQGVTTLTDSRGAAARVLSWHQPGLGLEVLEPPADPTTQPWSRRELSSQSQDEALSAADLDGDGDLDLVLGTRWLRNDREAGWTPLVLHQTDANPDRNRVADLDGDGRLDVVIGFEAISAPGKLAWYQAGSDPAKPWSEHPIAQLIGPMSLDVADMDGDGDLDLVAGEHNLARPRTARLLWFENLRGDASLWLPRLIHTGDEHHDGALAVDIDRDGDLDLVSIGWGHDRLILYENLAKSAH